MSRLRKVDCGAPGITRRRRGRGWEYFDEDGRKVEDPEVVARIEANSRPRYFQGLKTHVELVADRATHRLVGGTVIGEDGAAGRINVIAGALQAKMRVDDFEQLDLAYSPPFSPVMDPLLIAAQQLMKALGS